MIAIGLLLILMLCDCFKPRPRLEAEILILRHQLNVLHYYNEVRTHLSLGKDAPCTRPIERFGDIIAQRILGGLHHRYARSVF